MSNGSSIDDKIVSIKFDNVAFEQKISETMATLDKFSQKISGLGTTSGFGNLTAQANAVNLSNIGTGVDHIASKFSAMGAIAFSAIQQVTQNLLGFAGRFAQTDILSPIITGGKTRAAEIQMAQFQFQGLGLNTAEVMQNALDAVKGTAFGLGDAAKAAAQFGASGVQAGAQMKTSLTAIAGVAALTGTQFNQMSYLFTQGAAKGHIDNQDLMQFATNGFNAAAAYAKANHLTEQSVHDMAAHGKLDYQSFAQTMADTFGKHATDANQTYAGSLDNLHAAMSRLGASFIGPELFQQRDLFNALGPVVDKLTTSLQPLFFTLLSAKYQAGQGIIGTLNNINWDLINQAGQKLAEGLQNVFNFLKQIGSIAKSAFKDIFPTSFGNNLVLIADKFKQLTESLKLGGPASDKLKSIFKGLFSVLDIGWGIIKGVVSVIGDLLHALFPAGDGLFNMAAKTGNLLTKLDEFLIKGGKLQAFFDKLGAILAVPIKLISELAAKIAGFFSAGISNVVGDALGQIKGRLSDAASAATNVTGVWDKLKQSLQGVFHVLDAVWNGIRDWFHQLFQKIAAEMQPADFNSALDAVNVGLLGGITLMLKKFFSGGIKFGFGGGVFNNIKNTLNGVTRSLSLMQTNLKAAALEKIAIAIGILAAALVVLSLINSKDLTKALAAMVIGFGELAAMMLVLDKSLLNPTAAAKLAIVSGALIGVAAAMVIFALAIRELSKLSMGELAKGLIGVGAGLAILVTGVNAISADTGGLIRAGISMGIIAIAMRILANAVKAFSGLSWSEMGKGLVGVSVGLAAIVLAMNAMPGGGLISGLGFIAIAVGLRILADSVKAMGGLDMKTLAKGLGGIIIALAGIALAMNFMPADLPITAIGVGILAIALGLMADVIKKLGGIPFGTLAKGLLALAVTLGIIAIGVNVMDASLPGAVALVIVAGALEIFADVLKKIGQLSIAQLATGIGAIAAVILVLAGASILLSEAIPFMLALGAALILVGGGFALFGAGAFLLVSALVLFSKVGIGAIKAIVTEIPALASAGADFVINLINDILKGAPTIIKTLRAVIDQLLTTSIKEAPKLAKALEEIITKALDLIQKDFPLLVQTGILMLESLLSGIQDNIGQITDSVSNIIDNFLNALAANLPSIVDAAANLIVTFLTELGNHIDEIVAAGINLLAQLLIGIGQGEVDMATAAVSIVVSFIQEIGKGALQIINAGVQLLEQLLFGIGSDLGSIVGTVANVIITFVNELGKHILDVMAAGVKVTLTLLAGMASDAIDWVTGAAQILLKFLDAFDGVVKQYEPQIVGKAVQIGVDIVAGIFKGIVGAPAIDQIGGWLHGLGSKIVGFVGDIGGWVSSIGRDIVKGIFSGIESLGGWIVTKIHDWVIAHIPAIIRWVLRISSPSKVMADQVGKYIPLGIMMGIESQTQPMRDTMSSLANTMVDAFNPDPKDLTSVFASVASQMSGMNEFNPTITPVLDLSKIQEGAGGIAGLLGIGSISPGVSTQTAAVISSSVTDASSAAATTATDITGSGDVVFNQTINSPAALSTNDIYRNTKSQLTLAKEELGIS